MGLSCLEKDIFFHQRNCVTTEGFAEWKEGIFQSGQRSRMGRICAINVQLLKKEERRMGKGSSKKSRRDKSKRFYGEGLRLGSKRKAYDDPGIKKDVVTEKKA